MLATFTRVLCGLSGNSRLKIIEPIRKGDKEKYVVQGYEYMKIRHLSNQINSYTSLSSKI